MRLVRVAASLIRPLVRAISWLPLLVVTPIVPAMAWLLGMVDGGLPPDLTLVMLRATGLLLGAAAAYALTDQMAASTAALPVPRWWRQWLRTALAGSYAALAWAGSYAAVAARSTGAPPWWDTTVEAAVCVACGLAGAGFLVRRVNERYAASAGAATLFALVLGSLFLPDDWSAWPEAGTPHWGPAHTGWLLALPVVLAGLAIAHRDTRTAA
jgi:hypothetical protein